MFGAGINVIYMKRDIEVVDVEQRPVNPWNAAVGGSISFNRHWDLMTELGSNFEDAIVVVLSAAYRF